MKLPVFKNLRKEDFPDSPNWMTEVFYILNNFMTTLSNGLNKQITFQDNIACQIFTFTFTAQSVFDPFVINTTVKTTPIGVVLLQVNDDTDRVSVAANHSWIVVNGGVKITDITNLTVNHKYTVRFLII